MIVEVLLTLGFALVFRHLLVAFDWNLRVLLWGALCLHLGVVIWAHIMITQNEPTGIIHDSSVDAQAYYETARFLADRPIASIERADITRVSGTVWHMGYQYLLIIAMKVSAHSMLLVRLIKVYLFFVCLALLARLWVRVHGKSAAMFGVAYVGLLWWEIAYFNVRNFRDGLIACLCALVYVSWQRLLEVDQQRNMRSALFVGASIVALLLILVQFRVYMAAFLIGGIAIDLVIGRGAARWKVAIAMGVMLVAVPFLVDFNAVVGTGVAILSEGAESLGALEVGVGALKAITAPVPWQYSHWFLVPSQCFYVVMLVVACWAVVRVTPRPWGQLFLVSALILFMSVGLESSYARKRAPVVPIIAGWMVAGLSAANKRRPVQGASAHSVRSRS